MHAVMTVYWRAPSRCHSPSPTEASSHCSCGLHRANQRQWFHRLNDIRMKMDVCFLLFINFLLPLPEPTCLIE